MLCDAGAASLTQHSRTSSWLRLIHYEFDISSPTGLRSAIHSPEFFLSRSGQTDPEAELDASLAAMLEPVSGSEDAHAKCRFPARLIWLRENLPEHREALAPIHCPEFAAWSSIDDIDSLSLVFANGYLGNPASYYGHLFLKFNTRKEKKKSYLIDQTLNFGAIGTQHDDPFSYIVKGIAGGYDGGFSPVDFYVHNANYGENELRDLWEYRLNLPPAEVRYIVSHAWEVTQKKYVYYFFHDNCAFRVAELLEIVDGIKVTPRYRPWIIPQAVLQEVSKATYLERPLLAGKSFHPSRQTRLYQRFASLDASQRTLVAEIIDRRIRIAGPEIQGLPISEQQAVIDTVLDYHQIQKGNPQQGTGKMSPAYVEALSARLRLPPGDASKPANEPVSPDASNAPGWIQIGMVHRQNGTDTQMLRIRPAYYDALDVSGTQARNSGLSMGDMLLELEGQRVHLRHLDLISIDSMTPAVTGLPGDRGAGWRLKAGLEQQRLACTNCLATRVQGDYGIGSLIGSAKVFGSIHAGGALQGHTDIDGLGFARLGTSLVVRPSPDFGFRIDHEARRPFDAGRSPYTVTSIEARTALGKKYDFRARWDRDQTGRISLAVGRYW